MKKLKVGKKSGLKYFSIDDIRSWGPYYNPVRYLPEDWRGTAVDVLKREGIPYGDRLWAVLRSEIVSDRVMRLFAVWSYRQTLNFVPNPDPRSIECANVAERFAMGLASQEELAAARAAAWSAAACAAESAAWSAAWSAESAARAAAWSAAACAAESAAWSAAWSARSAAESATWSFAWSARSAQRDKLIEMIIAEGKESRK